MSILQMRKLRHRGQTSLVQLGSEPGSCCCCYKGMNRAGEEKLLAHFLAHHPCLINSSLGSPVLTLAAHQKSLLKAVPQAEISQKLQGPHVTKYLSWGLAGGLWREDSVCPPQHWGPKALGTKWEEFTTQMLSSMVARPGPVLSLPKDIWTYLEIFFGHCSWGRRCYWD